ncbi:GNAT family N-acetyltransferase, partial [Enterococcus lactis]|uniref:GNAT family N-acetyltransferase n=1 Tax=Enterococcus lactis TaxID=357441 RepID=UPI003C12FD25
FAYYSYDHLCGRGDGGGVGGGGLWFLEVYDLNISSYLIRRHWLWCIRGRPHIGFTTWSGNKGMQKIGEKCGMTKEGVIRKVRFLNNQYYDSVKYGILREELAD